MVRSSKEDSVEKGKKLILKKTDKYYLSQLIKVNINSDNDIDSMYPWYEMMKIAPSYGLPPQNP